MLEIQPVVDSDPELESAASKAADFASHQEATVRVEERASHIFEAYGDFWKRLTEIAALPVRLFTVGFSDTSPAPHF